MTQKSINVPVRRVGLQDPVKDSDHVAVEEPMEVCLRYCDNGAMTAQSIFITMRTPEDDFDLATGFLFTEGIIRSASEITSVRHINDQETSSPYRNVVEVELDSDVTVDIDRLKRNFYATSSCGICGKSSLDALSFQLIYEIPKDTPQVAPEVILKLPEALRSQQPTFLETGGLHAASLFDCDGGILDVREDVGRHNALDKLIGGALRNNILPLTEMGILLSGRASFELMQKTRMAGCPLVVAVGAPSSLAVNFAWEFDMTLVGFLRDGRFNVYSGPARVGQSRDTHPE